jgi:hypothetical protein
LHVEYALDVRVPALGEQRYIGAVRACTNDATSARWSALLSFTPAS